MLTSTTYAGLITNNNPGTTSVLTVDQTSNGAYYGSIQDGSDGGVVSLDMAGSGVLVLDGNNAYSGGTTVLCGLFVVPNANALPCGTSLTVGAGGIFIFDPSVAPPSDTGETPAPTGPGQGRNSQGGGGLGTNPPASPAPPIDVAPVITSIQCVGQPLVDADSVQFSITFSKPVTGLSTSNFAVSGDGTTGTVTAVSAAGGSYTVTVSGITGSGTLGLNVVDAGTILDWFGTPLDVTTIILDQQFTICRNLYWSGGTGDLNTGYLNVGSPSGPLQQYVDGSNLFLCGTPGTITITSPVQVASLTFLSDGWVLQGATITLIPSPPAPLPSTGEGSVIDVAAGTATIDCQIVGAFAKTDNGTLVLESGTDPSSSMTVMAGVVNLDGTTATMTSVTLVAGSIVNGTLDATTAFTLYSGTILADMTGTAALTKLGSGTAIVAGQDTYQGGSNALDGTLVAAYEDSLPGAAVGTGIVIVQPTLYGSGDGDWTTFQWALAHGTSTGGLTGAAWSSRRGPI